MARPTRTNAEYFYHPASFRNDRRVKAIRARYGACGYGLLMMLIELLTDADNTALATDEMELELLAGDLNAEASEVAALISAAEKVGLFGRTEAGLLKCEQLDTWLAPVFEKRNRSKNAATAAKLPQPATETPITVTETPPVENSTVQNSREQDKPSSLQSEGAADAASEPEKKIGADQPSENPTPGFAHQGGAADVPTRKRKGRQSKPKPEPGSSNAADYQMPEWATTAFVEKFAAWLGTRQARTDCRPLTAAGVQARLNELAGYDELFCQGLFRQAEQNPHWQGLTFDNTPHKFTQHCLDLQKLQANATRQTQSANGLKPSGAAAADVAEFLVRRRFQQPGGTAGHTGQTTGTHPGQGPTSAAGFAAN